MDRVKDPKIIFPSFVFFLFLVFASLNYFNILRLDNMPPKTVSKPTPIAIEITPSVAPSLESCSIKKEGNPLVEDVKKADEKTIIGTFRGNITKVTVHLDNTASIDLYSIRGGQGHTFRVKEEKGLVYDAVNLKDLTLTDLKKGNTVTMSFNCFPAQRDLFRITRISVTGRM